MSKPPPRLYLNIKVTGTKHVTEQFRVRNPRLAVELFRRKHGLYPDYVDNRRLMGFCEQTGTPVLEGDLFQTDGDERYVLVEKVDKLPRVVIHRRLK